MSTLFKNLSPAQRTSPQANIINVDVMEQPETWRSQTFLQVSKDFLIYLPSLVYRVLMYILSI